LFKFDIQVWDTNDFKNEDIERIKDKEFRGFGERFILGLRKHGNPDILSETLLQQKYKILQKPLSKEILKEDRLRQRLLFISYKEKIARPKKITIWLNKYVSTYLLIERALKEMPTEIPLAYNGDKEEFLWWFCRRALRDTDTFKSIYNPLEYRVDDFKFTANNPISSLPEENRLIAQEENDYPEIYNDFFLSETVSNEQVNYDKLIKKTTTIGIN
jgi:hypothetical protein